MGKMDGKVVNTEVIVDNGPSSQRFNLVILGDGYREVELDQYRSDAQKFVDAFLAASPFDTLRAAFNVFRIDVQSTDSGADLPQPCFAHSVEARTFFDATFCTQGVGRLLSVDGAVVVDVANAEVPEWRMLIVLVNSTEYGGSGDDGGGIACFSLAPGADDIALHEMGHAAFGLADEYGFYAECGKNEGRNRYKGKEPSAPNVTSASTLDAIKWKNLIPAGTAVPTSRNPDCADCDPNPSPVPHGTVGAFEGAAYYHCGLYRPEFDCRMRTISRPFCSVCQEVIRRRLKPFLPAGSPG